MLVMSSLYRLLAKAWIICKPVFPSVYWVCHFFMHLLSMIGDRRTQYLQALLQNHRQTSLKLTVIIQTNVTHFKRLSLFQTCLSLSIKDLKNPSFPSTYPLPSFHVTIRVIKAEMAEWFFLVALDLCHCGRSRSIQWVTWIYIQGL